ncbi:lipoprotein [Burkholderiaceae bacterium UC74_6]
MGLGVIVGVGQRSHDTGSCRHAGYTLRMKVKSVCLAALLLTLAGLMSACGQKGPLYLPKPAAAAPASTASAPASSAAATSAPR